MNELQAEIDIAHKMRNSKGDMDISEPLVETEGAPVELKKTISTDTSRKSTIGELDALLNEMSFRKTS